MERRIEISTRERRRNPRGSSTDLARIDFKPGLKVMKLMDNEGRITNKGVEELIHMRVIDAKGKLNRERLRELIGAARKKGKTSAIPTLLQALAERE